MVLFPNSIENPTELPDKTQQIAYSVGVMAYNEEANIQRTLQAHLEQYCDKTRLAEIFVVAKWLHR